MRKREAERPNSEWRPRGGSNSQLTYKAKVQSYDSRCCVVAIALEGGHRIEVPFGTSRILHSGEPVFVRTDAQGNVKSVEA